MSVIVIFCGKCYKKNIIKKSNISCDLIESYPAQMGSRNLYEGSYQLSCECRNKITLNYSYREYPENTPYDESVTLNGGYL